MTWLSIPCLEKGECMPARNGSPVIFRASLFTHHQRVNRSATEYPNARNLSNYIAKFSTFRRRMAREGCLPLNGFNIYKSSRSCLVTIIEAYYLHAISISFTIADICWLFMAIMVYYISVTL